jgi:1,4-dihydroxy-2-naphthoate octaprenyltransferase
MERMKQTQAWWLAIRPRTLTAAIAPVVVGSALAWRDGAFQLWAALAALLAAVLIQIGTNFANDVYDFKKGADTAARVGPTRVTSAGLLTPKQVELGMWAVFALAVLLGAYLIYVGGWPILLIGMLSILAGLAYTAGPFPLGYNGLGDVAVFIFFGLIAVTGTYYVQARTLTPAAWLVALPIGAIATAIIVVNNVRDADTDRAAGKRTLAVLLGRPAARLEYLALLFAAYAAPFVLWLVFQFSVWTFLPLLTLPIAYRHVRALYTIEGPALNRTLGGTAQLLAQYGALLALGILFH